MDVLSIIKADNDVLKEKIVGIQSATGVKNLRLAFEDFAMESKMSLALGRDYLYPELDGLFAGADSLIDSATQIAQSFEKKTKSIQRLISKPASDQKGLGKKIVELEEATACYISLVEESVMPKIRTFIRTEDREDLADVFNDAKEDMILSMGATVRTRKQRIK
jgi:hypothetical protein